MRAIIRKGDGTEEAFSPAKLRRSLKRAGAKEREVVKVIAHIEAELAPGMSTEDIYTHAFQVLRRMGSMPVAARYSLRRAVMDLGPTGFPFEAYLAELFRTQGFSARTDVVLKGACVSHEIDVLAESKDRLIIAEAKFHNTPGFKTDLKVVLYVHARCEDLGKTKFGGRLKKGQTAECFVVTNTKFSESARAYGECSGMILVAWDTPKGNALQDMIERARLHPITSLTTINAADKRALAARGCVLCRSIQENPEVLETVGIKGQKAKRVMSEVELLCTLPIS